jgi:hypothetical protein
MSGKRQVAELQAEEYGAAGAGPPATQLLAPIRKFNKLGDALAVPHLAAMRDPSAW